jgi:hypothetical protein
MNQAAVTGCATDAETVSIGRSRAVGGAQLAILGLLILLLPLGIRFTDRTGPEPLKAASALPALGFPRQNPFDASRIPDLRRLNPGWVVIGDSMAGTRIDERRLGELAGRPVAPLLQAGSGRCSGISR